MSAAKFPAFVRNMNNFYELCGNNESEAARRLGVKAALFHRWRIGENAPTKLSRPEIARVLGVNVHELMYGAGAVNEDTVEYERPLTRAQKKALATVDDLIKSGDEEILKHLEQQIDLLWELYKRRTGRGEE